MLNSAVNTRFLEFAKHNKLTQRYLADTLKTSQPTISAILSGKRELSRGMVARIIEAFPYLNKSWLLTGEGSMLRDEQRNAKSFGEVFSAIGEGDMMMGEVVQKNSNGDNFNGEQIVLKDGDTHDFMSMLKKRDQQIDRLLAIIEKMQGL